MSDVTREMILKNLEPLFQEAVIKKKFFLSTYQAIVMSPRELRDHHKRGELIWGPLNWKLVDPPDLEDEDDAIHALRKRNKALKQRLENAWDI